MSPPVSAIAIEVCVFIPEKLIVNGIKAQTEVSVVIAIGRSLDTKQSGDIDLEAWLKFMLS